MSTELLEKPRIENKKAKRCSDFDEDCAYVDNYFLCWQGYETSRIWVEPADGYCPYLIGMMGEL